MDKEIVINGNVVAIQDILAFPATIRCDETGLEISELAADDDVVAGFFLLRRLDGSMSWWIGDFLNAVMDRKGGQFAGSDVAREMAESFSLGYDGCLAVMRVCREMEHLIRIKCSRFGTFTHHRVALAETRDVKQARRWVQVAVDEQLSVSRMRAKIREGRRMLAGHHTSAIAMDLSPLNKMAIFVKRMRPEDIPPMDRPLILEQFRAVGEWWRELERLTPR